ncbi:hypothetical protein D9M70_426260 [compost metagenome]
MHAAAGQRAHGIQYVGIAGIDHVGGAELARQFQLGRHAVDGDDAAGAGNRGTVDRSQADAAAADHGHGLARLHFGGMDDRAHARGDGAADQRRAVQRHVAADRHQCVLVDQHLLGKGRQVQELVHGSALPCRQARLLAFAAAGIGLDAQRQVPCQAMLAMAAVCRQAGDDVVAGPDRAHLGANLLDHAGGLVPQDGRHRIRIGAVQEMQVRVAHAHGGGAHQHFARARLADGNVFDHERGLGLMQDGGFHNAPLRRACQTAQCNEAKNHNRKQGFRKGAAQRHSDVYNSSLIGSTRSTPMPRCCSAPMPGSLS